MHTEYAAIPSCRTDWDLNFQPLLLNHENDGKDWTRHNVRISQPLKRNEKTATGSEEIWSYMEEILEQSIRDGKIIDDREEKQE
jgi:putative hydrolase of HD superfamily